MPRLGDESGQTLVELMVATVIGLIVIFAAFLMLQTSLVQGAKISSREDSAQRGRLAMEQITRELRSQICVEADNPSIAAGTNTSITFVDDLSGNTAPPVQRTITYVPPPTATPTGPGKIVESRIAGDVFPPGTSFTATPTSVTLLDNVVPIPGVPVFQYYTFSLAGNGGLNPTPLVTPLDDTRRGLAVDVKVSFLVRGGTPRSTGNPNADSTSFQDDVYTRVADPTQPLLGTNCS